MLRLFLRGQRAAARRTATTALAVVLGVALISGTLVLTDTIGKSFDRITEARLAGIDVVLTPPENRSLGRPDAAGAPQLPADLVRRVRAVPGVRDVSGLVQGDRVSVLRRDGRQRVTKGFAPGLAVSVQPSWVGESRYAPGRAPRSAGEIALDTQTAKRGGYRVGDRVPVQGDGPLRRLRLVGLVSLGDAGQSFGGASVVVGTEATTTALAGRPARSPFAQVNVLADPGTSPDRLADAIRPVAGGEATVRTGKAETTEQAKAVRDQLSFLPTILLVFAGIATFVGAFLILNTFTITVAQRQREHALLRALGASRRQIRALVLGEGAVVGLLGSVVGVAGGFAVAPLLRELLKAVGADLPSTATVFATRTAVVGVLVGIGVTTAAILVPAARATRVPPLEALRDASAPPAEGRVRRAPVIAGALAVVLGVAVAALGVGGVLDGDAASAAAGGGSLLIFVGALLLAPLLVAPLATLLGSPLQRVFGLPGRLARDNAIRQPGRTAVTAGALTIGLALVVFATVFAAGLKGTLREDLEKTVGAPVVVQARDAGATPVPSSVPADLRRSAAVRTAGSVSFARIRIAGKNRSANVADGVLLDRGLLRLRTPGGDAVRDPGRDGIVLAKDVADELGVAKGATLRVTGTNGRTVPLRVAAVVEKAGLTLAPISLDAAAAARLGTVRPAVVLVDPVSGGPTAVGRLLRAQYPSLEAISDTAWIADQTKQVDQLLGLVYGLLALSVIVALFGIVNALGLAVAERRRELGLLRAVGATRRQVRRMVTLEALITSVLGAILGVVLGFVLAVAVGATLDGFRPAFPVAQVLALVVVAALAGIAAAVLPARRAARTDVLVAIGNE